MISMKILASGSDGSRISLCSFFDENNGRKNSANSSCPGSGGGRELWVKCQTITGKRLTDPARPNFFAFCYLVLFLVGLGLAGL